MTMMQPRNRFVAPPSAGGTATAETTSTTVDSHRVPPDPAPAAAPDPAPAATPAAIAGPQSAPEDAVQRVVELEREVTQLRHALSTRPPVEHAVGMLMWLLRCDEVAAFAALARLSQNTNRKVVDLAQVFAGVAQRRQPWPPDVHAVLRSLLADKPPR